jgi:hypothetical protein
MLLRAAYFVLGIAFVAAVLATLRFLGFPAAAALIAGIVALRFAYSRFKAGADHGSDVTAPLPGLSLQVQEQPALRFGPDPSHDVEEFEIGSTGPRELQFVMLSKRRRATVRMSAEQARWMAMALNHWADRSEGLPSNDL